MGFFFFYACMTMGTGAYVYVFFPETKGKSLEEVEEYFERVAAQAGARRNRKKGGNREGEQMHTAHTDGSNESEERQVEMIS